MLEAVSRKEKARYRSFFEDIHGVSMVVSGSITLDALRFYRTEIDKERRNPFRSFFLPQQAPLVISFK